ncbi:Ankyrin repeat and LEM domain-containing protein 1 [Trichinella spiralis]|uniref:Ankyrin repeat and LEM domain-containing protein 1 n=1 Tax=Trichinella spiralis TaxID=6334 RepID=A0A0V1B2V4_TRISP|nr:Ankyrin repeat and LEM domain-containing protein 1 [Trichinella spiralis]
MHNCEDVSLWSAIPLHLAAGFESVGAYSLMQEHLNRGADPNHRNSDGLTPVHIAAAWGRLDNLKLLLLNGGDPLIADNDSFTALDMAIEEQFWPCVKLIVWWCGIDRSELSSLIHPKLREQFQLYGEDQVVSHIFPSSRSSRKIDEHLNEKQEQEEEEEEDIDKVFEKLLLSSPKSASPSTGIKRITGSCTVRKCEPDPKTLQKWNHSLTEAENRLHSSVDSSVLVSCERMTNAELRKALTEDGYCVGPVTKQNRKIYIYKLAKNLSEKRLSSGQKFSVELEMMFKGRLDRAEAMNDIQLLKNYFEKFRNSGTRWREGSLKNSFCYFLIDPTVTDDLPSRANSMRGERCNIYLHRLIALSKICIFLECEIMQIFCKSIFYIGKGKKCRPLQHLKDAAKRKDEKTTCKKLRKILQLWTSDQGVVSFHVWNNITPIEAYTREAAMIDAIGLKNLCNRRRGEYHGPASLWTSARQRQLGAYLLETAAKIFLLEGERCFKLADVMQK